MRRYQDVRPARSSGRRKSPISPRQQRLWQPRPVYRGWRRLAYSWPALTLLAALTLLSLPRLWRVYSRFSTARDLRNEAAAKLGADEARQTLLQNKIRDLNTPEGREAEIRRTYQVALPGEGVIVLVGTTSGR